MDGSVSSQFLTALLMAAPLAPQDTVIAIKGELVSRPYIDITLHLVRKHSALRSKIRPISALLSAAISGISRRVIAVGMPRRHLISLLPAPSKVER